MSGLKAPTGELDRISREELIEALQFSVGHQSHYANLLNMHDGGARIQFGSVLAWIERLREVAARPAPELRGRFPDHGKPRKPVKS